MGRRISIHILAVIYPGRVHLNDSPEPTSPSLSLDGIDVDLSTGNPHTDLRDTYQVLALVRDEKHADLRRTHGLKHFSVWDHQSKRFLKPGDSWTSLGTRDDDIFVLLPEDPEQDVADYADVLGRQARDLLDRKRAADLTKQVADSIREGSSMMPKYSTQPNTVFVAMPMNEEANPALVDTLTSIKEVCVKHGITAKRVDDEQTNAKISHSIDRLIQESQYVICDLTLCRPNVFFEAGYAVAIGKTPIFIQSMDTPRHFDTQDYPTIDFKNQTELKRKLDVRLSALTGKNV